VAVGRRRNGVNILLPNFRSKKTGAGGGHRKDKMKIGEQAPVESDNRVEGFDHRFGH
jgi:hypothetical protein